MAPSGGGGGGGGGSGSFTATPATFRTLLTSQYLSAKDGGGSTLTAGSKAVGAAETFTLTDLDGGALTSGDEVRLAASGGQYISAKNGHPRTAVTCCAPGSPRRNSSARPRRQRG